MDVFFDDSKKEKQPLDSKVVQFIQEVLSRGVDTETDPLQTFISFMEENKVAKPIQKKVLERFFILFGEEETIFALFFKEMQSFVGKGEDISSLLTYIYPRLSKAQKVDLFVLSAKSKEGIDLFKAVIEKMKDYGPEFFKQVFGKLEGLDEAFARRRILGMAVIDDALRDKLFNSPEEGAKFSAKEGCFDLTMRYLYKEYGEKVIDPLKSDLQKSAQQKLELIQIVKDLSEIEALKKPEDLELRLDFLFEDNRNDLRYGPALLYVRELSRFNATIDVILTNIERDFLLAKDKVDALERAPMLPKPLLEELLALALNANQVESDVSRDDFVHILLENGAGNIKIGDQGETALTRALSLNLKPEIIQALIRSGQNLELAPIGQDAPIMVAFKRGDREAVKALLEKGVSPNTKDTKGSTLLHLAATKAEDVQMLSLLLVQDGLELNSLNAEGNTPLLLSYRGLNKAEKNSIERAYFQQLFDSLRVKKAEVCTSPNTKGQTLLTYAVHYKDKELALEILKSKNFDLGQYLLGVWRSGNQNRFLRCIRFIAEDLAREGLNWNASKEQNTLLALAITEGEEALAKQVLTILSFEGEESRKEKTLFMKNLSKQTPLALACERGMTSIAGQIVDLMPELMQAEARKENGYFSQLLSIVPEAQKKEIREVLLPTKVSQAKSLVKAGWDLLKEIARNMVE